MTRYIVILALALTAGLSSGNASAQQANAVPLLALSMQSASGQIGNQSNSTGFYDRDVHYLSMPALPDGLAVMDLWFALVDAGYSEDEAFELMTLENGGNPVLTAWLVGGGYRFQGWVYDEDKMEMYWVD